LPAASPPASDVSPPPPDPIFLTSPSANPHVTAEGDATTTTLTASANPASYGQAVTFEATVANASGSGSGTPTGAVQFEIDGALYRSPVALSGGTAGLSGAAPAVGTPPAVAGYAAAHRTLVGSG